MILFVRSFNIITILLLTLMSSYFFVNGTLTMTDQGIYQATTMGFGGINYELTASMLQQKFRTKIGFCLLFASIILQTINLTLPFNWDCFNLNRWAALTGFLCSILLFGALLYTDSIKLDHTHWNEVAHKIIDQNRE